MSEFIKERLPLTAKDFIDLNNDKEITLTFKYAELLALQCFLNRNVFFGSGTEFTLVSSIHYAVDHVLKESEK